MARFSLRNNIFSNLSGWPLGVRMPTSICSSLISATVRLVWPVGKIWGIVKILLNCTALKYTALHCTVLHGTALNYTALHCTALQCTALH